MKRNVRLSLLVTLLCLVVLTPVVLAQGPGGPAPQDIPEGTGILLLVLFLGSLACFGALAVAVVVFLIVRARRKRNRQAASVPQQHVNMASTAPRTSVNPPEQAPPAVDYAPRESSQAVYQQPPVQQYTPPPAPANVPLAAAYTPSEEPIVGLLGGLGLQKGMFKSETYNLVVTTERLIFAELTSAMVNAQAQLGKEQAKAEGKGFFKQWGAMLSANNAILERYNAMPIADMLRESPNNFTVPLSQISKARVISGSSDDDSSSPDQLVIHAGRKMKFTLKGTSAGQVKRTLRQVLGNRVR